VNVARNEVSLFFGRSLAVVMVMPWFIWPARAELPPQYTIWQDFAAVTAQAAIPTTLGVVDRIERTPNGKYQVRAGNCFVEVSITREPATGADGRPMPGPSHIVKVDVSDKRCDR
jgi:hypothetical protein